jgi:hypothetical protein
VELTLNGQVLSQVQFQVTGSDTVEPTQEADQMNANPDTTWKNN